MLLWLSFIAPWASADNAIAQVDPADRALLMAVGQGQTTRVESLLKAGANINTPHPPWQLTPLQVASDLNVTMVKLLLAHGATVNVADRDGVTPLMRAVDLRDVSMIQTLLDAGAEINAKDHRGHTPLTRAVLRSDAAILKLLIKRGADVDVVSEMGTTPWSIAQNMHEAALIMPEPKEEKPHVHTGHASHPMRDKKESLSQTQAVLEVLAATGVEKPQQPAKLSTAGDHHH